MSLVSTLRFILRHPANHRRSWSALGRFIRWQVSGRLFPGIRVVDWIGSAKYLAKLGDTGLTGNVYAGLHEFQDMGYLLHVLRPEDTFVDVGANLGSYTILAGAVVGSRVIAFEPVPETYERLVDNIRINHVEDRVVAHNVGLAERKGRIAFTRGLDTVNHALAEHEDASDVIEVEVESIDTMLEDFPPDLIKIDVEGYESLVLAGGAQTLTNPRLHSVIMELNGSGLRYGFDEGKILEFMHGLGFKAFAYDPATRSLAPATGGKPNTGNTIFIRNDSFVRERLRKASAFTVLGRQF